MILRDLEYRYRDGAAHAKRHDFNIISLFF